MVLPELRKRRLATGKSVRELAELLQVDEMIYMLYERDSDRMPFDALLRLAELYGVSPQALYRGAYLPTRFS